MTSLGLLVYQVLSIYSLIVIVAVVMSWLIQFNVINPRNEFVGMVIRALYSLTEPVFARIRQVMPDLGGLDLSPMVLILGIWFAQMLIVEYWPGVAMGRI